MNRAYSLLTIKSVDAEHRVITGLATSPTPDRMGDIVDPLGVSFTNPLPLLLYHDSHLPVGTVIFKKPTKDGIAFEARIPQVDQPASLKDRVDTAWGSIKAGLLKGVSIGFRSLEQSFNKDTNGFRFLRTEVLELSLVAIPANADASIHTIKQYDTPAPAASGTRQVVAIRPGVSGSPKAQTMQPISEQLTAERATLQTKSTRLSELITREQAEGGLETEESTERDTLADEVPGLTKKVSQLVALENAQSAMATSATVTTPPSTKTFTRPTQVEMPARPKGQLFTRYAMAVAAGKGSMSDTLAYARRFTDTPEVVNYIKEMHFKAEPGTSVVSSPAWGGELVHPTNLVSEFIDLLRDATILGKISGFRMTPFNIRVPRQTMGSTVAWVGEAAPKPVSELSFDTISMPYHKLAGIVVLTEELVRLSSPSAEEAVRRDLVEQIGAFIDQQFVDASVAAGANNPASITNGVTSPAASGADLQSFALDFFTALKLFAAANISTDGLVVITTPSIALGLSMFTNALGQTPVGFNVNPSGGTIYGYPLIASNSVAAGTLILLKPSEVLMADDGRVTLDASNQATLDMLGGSPGAPTFNLWQRNCVAIRAERWITWMPRRTGAVAVIDTAAYGPNLGSP